VTGTAGARRPGEDTTGAGAAGAGALEVGFSLRGIGGLIEVSVTASTDPDAIGYRLLTGGQPTDFAAGFPICRATVTYPADGYAAVFGWTQLVRSIDADADAGANGFELDPIAIYRDVPTPFAWYGLRPELFDAPSYETRDDQTWEAHSFLCVSPDAVLTRRVQAIAGFRWGFAVTGADITVARPAPLEAQAWDGHLGLLRASYPQWAFDPGYLPA
jgi:hypothetical protein